MADTSLEYRQTFHAVVSKAGGIKREPEGGPPVLYATNAEAAKECADREFVARVTLTWKQPAP